MSIKSEIDDSRAVVVRGGVTCVVLGAGASYPYWFPLGGELKTLLHSSRSVKHGIRGSGRAVSVRDALIAWFTTEEIRDFQASLQRSPQETIDRFLELRPEFQEIGKAAISIVVAFFECHCNYTKRRPNSGDLYRKLYHALFPTPPQPSPSIRIITFNYDRSLERYLMQGLCADAKLDEGHAWQIVEGLNIVHVHGSLGTRNVVWPITDDALADATANIKVLHETNPSNTHIAALRGIVQVSSDIVFLGFGYDKRNIELLDLRDDWPPSSCGRIFNHPLPPKKIVYGTCFGMTPGEVERVRARFSVECKIVPEHQAYDCFTFLEETGVLEEKYARAVADRFNRM